MVSRVGLPPTDVDDLVFGEGQGRGSGAAAQQQRVVVVGQFEVVGVGVVALESHADCQRSAAGGVRGRPVPWERDLSSEGKRLPATG